MLALGETYLEDICYPSMDDHGDHVNVKGEFILELLNAVG